VDIREVVLLLGNDDPAGETAGEVVDRPGGADGCAGAWPPPPRYRVGREVRRLDRLGDAGARGPGRWGLIGQARRTRSGVDASTSGSALPPADTGPPGGASLPKDPAGFDPERYLARMPRFDPDSGTRPKTHGRWTDHTGTTHDLLSGRHDGYHTKVDQHAVAIGLIPAGTGLARSGDIELRFAIRMRETWQRTGSPPREKIVINNPNGPCEGDLGCDTLLPRFLPPGAELTVHWPGGTKTYRGEDN